MIEADRTLAKDTFTRDVDFIRQRLGFGSRHNCLIWRRSRSTERTVDSVETQERRSVPKAHRRARDRSGTGIVLTVKTSALAALAQQSTKAAAILALLRPPQRRTSSFHDLCGAGRSRCITPMPRHPLSSKWYWLTNSKKVRSRLAISLAILS